MKPALVILAVALVCLQAAGAEPDITGKPAELAAFLETKAKTVAVAGEAEIKVPVDKAMASLRIVSEHRSFAEALQRNNELRANVVSALKRSGIPEDQLKGARFSSTPNYSVFSDKAKSYRVENLIRVTVTDDKEFLAVATTVDSLADVHFAGIEPEPGDIALHKKKALEAALKNASERRTLIEQGTGLVLKADSVTGINIGLGYPEHMRLRYGSSSMGRAPAQTSSSSFSPEPSPLAGGLGEFVVTATVTVTCKATSP
jgi:uncharacterized protein YggE